MTEFRTDNLERDQRIAALEDRVQELELLYDSFMGQIAGLPFECDVTAEEQAAAKFFSINCEDENDH